MNMMNVLIDLFVAGSETTSTTLNWALLFMLQNPRVAKKVQEELDTVFGVGQVVILSFKHKQSLLENERKCI